MTGCPDRNNNFNLIRLLAALGVMTTHASIVTGGMDAVQPMAPWLMGLTLGTLCVYAFFTVSGYLLTASLMANPDPLRFVTRRCARIFPALLLVTLSSLLAGAVLTREDGSTFLSGVPRFLLKNLTLTDFNHGLPGVFSQNPIPTTFNIPLWSLPYEIGCYALLLALSVFGILNRQVMKKIAWFLVPILILSITGLLSDDDPHDPEVFEAFTRYGFSFVMGSLLFMIRDSVRFTVRGVVITIILTVIAVRTELLMNPILQAGLAYLVIWASRVQAPLLTWFRRMGDYSYGTYLFGFPVQQVVVEQGWGNTPFTNLLISVPITLFLAMLSWHLVENKFIQR